MSRSPWPGRAQDSWIRPRGGNEDPPHCDLHAGHGHEPAVLAGRTRLCPKDGRGFDGDWPTLFGARQQKLRSIFLGDPELDGSGIVELVEFSGGMADAPAPLSEPAIGFFLVSVYLQIEPTLARLASLSLGGIPARISLEGGVQMAVVHDPNGVTVELIDRGQG